MQAKPFIGRWGRLLLCVLSGALFFLPLAQSQWPFITEPQLRERLAPLQPRSPSFESFTDRSLQVYWEQYIARDIGLRKTLLTLFNDLRLAAFPSRPNDHYVRSAAGGFFPVDTIRRFNYDLRNRATVIAGYDTSGRRLRILQDLLARRGVTFLAITAPPRVQIYPEDVAQYLALPLEQAAQQIYAYGDGLRAAGVNVVDGKALLLGLKQQDQPGSFANTGFHWNFWAACAVTAEAMQRIEAMRQQRYFPVDCSRREMKLAAGPDTDIALILNVSRPERLLTNTANVKLSKSDDDTGPTPLRIFLLGDSYADQITYTLLQTWPTQFWFPGALIRSDYFVQDISYNQRRDPTPPVPRNPAMLAGDVANSDVMIFEVSDGNVHRTSERSYLAEFGATIAYLKAMLPAGRIDSGNADAGLTHGWQPDATHGWRSNDLRAGLAFVPSAVPASVKLALPVTNLRADPAIPRHLVFSHAGKPVAEYRFTGSDHVIDLTIPFAAGSTDPHAIEFDIADAGGGLLDLAVARTAATQGKQPLDTALLPQHAGENVDLIAQPEQAGISVTGLGGFERNAADVWRWGLGPSTQIRSFLARDGIVELSYRFNTYQPDQVVEILWNNDVVRRYDGDMLRPGNQVADTLRLPGRAGGNRLDIRYANWNGRLAPPAGPETRPLSVVFLELMLRQQPAP
ncbi:hypothetical protein [Ferrovibrio sp.]|uniref:alginate O-acetyltransferase AlgX-related protein n=1 Tax=Ferrovibrio sp. TaxID=1917215 RepID=UPI0025C72096|nr:hypothetical protein [Ferrovibrio sp.]